GPRAVLNAVERIAAGYGSSCDAVRQEPAIAETQLRDYGARPAGPLRFSSARPRPSRARRRCGATKAPVREVAHRRLIGAAFPCAGGSPTASFLCRICPDRGLLTRHF